MKAISATEARANLDRVIKQVAECHEPVLITGEEADSVLLTKEDWDAIQETLFLLSIPGMRESIREGIAASVEECSTELEW